MKRKQVQTSNFVHVLADFVAHVLVRSFNSSKLNFASICRTHRDR